MGEAKRRKTLGLNPKKNITKTKFDESPRLFQWLPLTLNHRLASHPHDLYRRTFEDTKCDAADTCQHPFLTSPFYLIHSHLLLILMNH